MRLRQLKRQARQLRRMIRRRPTFIRRCKHCGRINTGPDIAVCVCRTLWPEYPITENRGVAGAILLELEERWRWRQARLTSR